MSPALASYWQNQKGHWRELRKNPPKLLAREHDFYCRPWLPPVAQRERLHGHFWILIHEIALRQCLQLSVAQPPGSYWKANSNPLIADPSLNGSHEAWTLLVPFWEVWMLRLGWGSGQRGVLYHLLMKWKDSSLPEDIVTLLACSGYKLSAETSKYGGSYSWVPLERWSRLQSSH